MQAEDQSSVSIPAPGRTLTLERDEVLRAPTGEARASLAMERYSVPFATLLRHPRLVEPGMQILGGHSMLPDADMERYFREGMQSTIGGGTSQIQRTLIAKTMRPN